ncbi:hybrid sensor histidine kinase/response regulator [Quisquiliibacterium transsilvanicum]|uniref:Chemotaxis protein CheA n=1 Tax=Quisquiliibacterium transsilvanicum TaxID=1549638 RepID=A0A7W8M6X9_9BURK|nr:response regulator [Quisquiliibacterium transsilvanicum]MBB5270148.1 chemosensory pili system protein ChpA (sensor histidine kinase/response regulator) [Quisquiliibacterium transsilvanicum]
MSAGSMRPDDAAAIPFERLNEASVALLDPLFEPLAEAEPQRTAARLGDAIMHCAQVADSLGLRSLNYLATLMVPYLQREAGGDGWPGTRDRIEGWIGRIIAFCAGHASPEEATLLVNDLHSWPSFPEVPEQFVNLIAARLRQDCALVAELVAELASAPPMASVARDELEMLLEAVEGLEAEVIGPLAGIGLPPPPAALGAVSDLVDLCRERLGNLAGAMRYVGLAPAADLLEPCRESLAAWRDAPASASPEAPELLHGLTQALAAFLRDPAGPALMALEGACTDARWPVRGEGVGAQARAALLGLEVVGSRRIEAPSGQLDADDVSLELAPDADASVLGHLLPELAALSAGFSEQIDRLVAAAASAQGRSWPSAEKVGEDACEEVPEEVPEEVAEPLAEARRIAHTLKGAANTVGIRGIALLTHRLEDLLQLLGERSGTPDAATRNALTEAADCLAEMADAVAGLGEGPADALGVCRSLGAHIDALLSAGAPPDRPEEAQPLPGLQSESSGPSQQAGPSSSLEPPSTLPDAWESEPSAPSPESAASAPAPAPAPAPAQVGELLRVPASLLDRILDLAGEAGILLARVQEQVDQLGEVRQAFRTDSDRLRVLAGELEGLVDIRGVSLSGRRPGSDFDPLELDDFNELHTVSRRIAEAGADARVLDHQLDRQGADLAEAVGQLERVQTDLREAVMQSRLVPVRSVLPRLQRVARQAARMAGKTVELTVAGEDTAVDARLLQGLLEPIGHLLRNAIDHGIEPAAERERAGKAAAGRVSLRFGRDGRRLIVHCTDDGRGLDLDAIRARAQEAGLIDPAAAPGPEALARLVLEPGFSTRRQATQLSGRGIGLDVVQRAVRALRGEIELAAADGAGLEVRIEVPEGMVAIPVVLVRTPSHVLALSIRGVERILPADGAVRDDAGALRFVGAHGLVPAVRLDELLGLPEGFFAREAEAARLSGRQHAAAAPDPGAGEVAMLVRGLDGSRVAVLSPPPGQTRNVVVRPLPPWLPSTSAVEGATVLGDGAVATVLDLPALVAPGASLAASRFPEQQIQRLPVCLVADDSVSVRRSLQLFLEDLGFEVDSAADGVDALALAARRVPALAIVDLEMPRMNGVELCRALRADPRTREVPVLMITSRSSERHRALAREAGVDVFLTKPYGEDELASEIRRCLVGRTALG